MTSHATSPDFIKFVVETYRHDFTGYRLDILGRKPNPATLDMEKSLVVNKRTAAGGGSGTVTAVSVTAAAGLACVVVSMLAPLLH